ncbi:hypothetical protein D7Z94_23950 [Ulvibacterium marinum]|uniref:Uncharacterized protein n=1 Tax=Ulvibacterium marinum TaxID=2419782 RepID=A0A3B0BXK6_9FLAO|nr:hypothetical protein D7Z94_23950 [Ulvibacterium marinum]
MVEKVLHRIITGNRFLCIEILLQEGKPQYHAIEVSRKGSALAIDSSVTYADFDELLKNIPKNRPTLLSFTGQGIISKKVENTGNYRSKLLFNASDGDFYWYELRQPTYIYVSVVRKSVIDDKMETFRKLGIFIVDISIGPLVVSVMKPLLPIVNSLRTRYFVLDFQNDRISDFAKHGNTDDQTFYEIDGEKIRSKDIVSFATLLNHLFPHSDIEFEKGFLKANTEEFRFRKAFNGLGVVALPGFLLALLASYLLLGHYQQAYINLQVELEEKNIAYKKLVLLENDRANKEAMLNESGLNDSNFLSFYLSEITKDIPPEIHLNELDIFAPMSKIKPGQRINFINDRVEIKGGTSSNDAFADWIKAIKKYHWIENLEIVDFRKDGASSSFEIRLKLKFNV